MTRVRTRVKICGVTTPEAAEAAVRAGADAVGLVFAEGSPRRLDPTAATTIRRHVPPFVAVVTVFRNPTPGLVEQVAAPTDLVQLHGDEDEAFLATLGRPVLRGFAFDPDAVRRWDACPDVCGLLVDGPSGGSGATFDHAMFARLLPSLAKPVFLAGGLTPANVGAAVRTVRPYAVDVSTGVESAPGVKDPAMIQAFCAAVRDADGK